MIKVSAAFSRCAVYFDTFISAWTVLPIRSWIAARLHSRKRHNWGPEVGNGMTGTDGTTSCSQFWKSTNFWMGVLQYTYSYTTPG